MKLYRDLTIRQKQIVWAWGFLALPVLFYSVIRFYPTGNAILISFQDWNLLGTRTWTGLDNYKTLFADPVFWQVFRNTFVYLLIGTPVSLVVSFVIAYHLDKTRFMHGFLRMLYFLPFMTSAVAMAWVWRWFYQPVPIGLFNNIAGRPRHPADSRSCGRPPGRCPRSSPPRSGPASAFRSSSSWQGCGRSRAATTKPPGSTACRPGRCCGRSPCRS